MEEKYKNEAHKLFDNCSKNENIMLSIYVVNIILMLLICFCKDNSISNILNYGLIIVNIIYIAISGYTDIILKNKAENELRKTMISNSFNINITTTKSEGYYTNRVEPSIKRLGVNNFESVLYTSKITEKMILKKVMKTLFIVVMWIIAITQIENIEIIVLLTQIIFSADILLDLIKILYYHINVKILYNNFYKIFVTDGYQEKDIPIIVEYVMEYECIKSYSHIVLPNSIFVKEKEELEKLWNQISKNIIEEN